MWNNGVWPPVHRRPSQPRVLASVIVWTQTFVSAGWRKDNNINIRDRRGFNFQSLSSSSARHTHKHTHEPDSPSSILPQVFFPPHQNQKQRFLESNRCSQSFLCSPAARGLDRLLGPVVEKVGEKVWKQTGEKLYFLSFYQKNKLAGLFKFWS